MQDEEFHLIMRSEETLVSDLLVDLYLSQHWVFNLNLMHQGEFVHGFVIDLPELEDGQQTIVSLDNGCASLLASRVVRLGVLDEFDHNHLILLEWTGLHLDELANGKLELPQVATLEFFL